MGSFAERASAWTEGGASGVVIANADEEFELGKKYFNGDGVDKSHSEALAHFLKAAELEHGQAQVWVGFIYQHGHGVPKDEALAESWYRKSAQNGTQDAVVRLAKLKGWFDAKYNREATEYFIDFAEKSHKRAREEFCWTFGDGKEVEQEYRNLLDEYRQLLSSYPELTK